MVHKLGEGLVKLDHITTSEIGWIPVGTKVVFPDMSMVYYERKTGQKQEKEGCKHFSIEIRQQGHPRSFDNFWNF
jgi:hypothetical protein